MKKFGSYWSKGFTVSELILNCNSPEGLTSEIIVIAIINVIL
jgi:hypothetical protein